MEHNSAMSAEMPCHDETPQATSQICDGLCLCQFSATINSTMPTPFYHITATVPAYTPAFWREAYAHDLTQSPPQRPPRS
ncbi:MAG: hypothetical protein CL570_00580 [Alphaproteobacteria bacterium]|nr:hypothetical protein [Alphaproteobacteria bacterium]HCQ71572.1 hypothetical protein [Rhodospirillaceae bacterium]